MTWKSFSGSLSTPQVDVAVDMGNHFLNLTVDGFLKVGTVASVRAIAEESYHVVNKGNFSKQKFEHALKKMCKDGAYWGTVAGVYVGMEYGVEKIRGTRDWKNAMIGGAITGALVSAVGSKDKDHVVRDAITGGAVATAAHLLNYSHNF